MDIKCLSNGTTIIYNHVPLFKLRLCQFLKLFEIKLNDDIVSNYHWIDGLNCPRKYPYPH